MIIYKIAKHQGDIEVSYQSEVLFSYQKYGERRFRP